MLTTIFDGRTFTYGFGAIDTLISVYAATLPKS